MSNPTPIYVRLGLDKAAYKSMLEELYWGRELSQSQIAKELNAHITTIETHFRKFDINVRPYTECDIWQRKSCVLSKKQLDTLDGIMLADGHLDASSVSARITYGCKFEQTLNDIRIVFANMQFGPNWKSKIDNWHFKSASYNNLKYHHDRWYYRGCKEVPSDLCLTADACYWWYVGDGYQVDYGIVLCTDSFSDDSKTILMNELRRLGFESRVIPSRGRIRICGKHAPAFLNWLAKETEIADQYRYKWGSHRRQSEQINV